MHFNPSKDFETSDKFCSQGLHRLQGRLRCLRLLHQIICGMDLVGFDEFLPVTVTVILQGPASKKAFTIHGLDSQMQEGRKTRAIFMNLHSFLPSGSLTSANPNLMRVPYGIWVFPKMVVPPKSYILIGFSIINHPFWGTSIFGNTHMNLSKSQDDQCFSWSSQHENSLPKGQIPSIPPGLHPSHLF